MQNIFIPFVDELKKNKLFQVIDSSQQYIL